VRQFIRNILPQQLIDFYKNQKKRRKQKQRETLASTNHIVTQNQIIEQLKENGLKNGEVVMLHSSLSKIGYVEGGAQTVIDSILKVIGDEGTLVMPAFPAIGFNYDYLMTNPVFDISNTPSKMGIITEVFRKMKQVKRSLHPTDSVCALGKQADYLIKDHYNQLTPYNQNSPFYRLCELKAKIILIGVDLNSLTNFHTLEDAVPDFVYPVYHQTLFDTQLIDESGKSLIMKTKVHNPAFSKKRKCNDFIKPFTDAGFMTSFKIGLANCYCIEADKLHKWMIENYKLKGITLYTPQGKN
jgi:aminoglycoside 3-N-acetyltransferase